MKIAQETLDGMFKRAGVSKKKMYAALVEMGPKELKAPLRKEWSADNPTRNFCYVVAEFVLNYCAPSGSKAYSLEIPGDLAKHYFVRTAEGNVIDLAAEQFSDYYDQVHSRYGEAKKTHFQHPSPSRRARRLAELLGYTNGVEN